MHWQPEWLLAVRNWCGSVGVYCLTVSFANRLTRVTVRVGFFPLLNLHWGAFSHERSNSAMQWLPGYKENPSCVVIRVWERSLCIRIGGLEMGGTVVSQNSSCWFCSSLLFSSPLTKIHLKHLPSVTNADGAWCGPYWRIRQGNVMALQGGGSWTLLQRSWCVQGIVSGIIRWLKNEVYSPTCCGWLYVSLYKIYGGGNPLVRTLELWVICWRMLKIFLPVN